MLLRGRRVAPIYSLLLKTCYASLEKWGGRKEGRKEGKKEGKKNVFLNPGMCIFHKENRVLVVHKHD